MMNNSSEISNALYDVYDYHVHSSVGNVGMAVEQQAPSMVTFAVVLTVWSYVINMLIIIVILSDASARQKVVYLQIVNVSATNVFASVTVMPLTIYYELHPWNLGHMLCKTYIISDVVLPFISIIAILFIDISQLIQNLRIRMFNVPSTAYVKFILLTLPWLLCMVTAVPIWTLGEKTFTYIPGLCIMMLNFEASVMSPILTFFIPSFLCVVFTTIILISNFKANMDDNDANTTQSRDTVTYLDQNRSAGTPLYQSMQPQSRKPSLSVVAVCLVNFSYVALWFPNKFITFQLSFCNECFPPIPIVVAFVWLGTSTSGIIPLMWYSDSNIRQMTRNYFTRCFTRKQNTEDTDIIDLEDMTSLN